MVSPGAVFTKDYGSYAAMAGISLEQRIAALLDKYGGVTWPFQGLLGFYPIAVNTALALGRNTVINGTFDSDTIWTKGTGWSIGGGKANCDGSQVTVSNLYQDMPLTIGKQYEVIFTVSNYSAGTVKIFVSDGGTGGTARSADGTYTETITAVGTLRRFYVQANAAFIGSVDNVTCREKNILASTAYPSADMVTNGTFDTDTAWTKSGGVTISGGTANFTGAAGDGINQNIGAVAGRTYRIEYDSVQHTSGALYLSSAGFTASTLLTTNPPGFYVTQKIAEDTDPLYFVGQPGNVWSGKLDNVRVYEVNPIRATASGIVPQVPAGVLGYAFYFDGINDTVIIDSPQLNSFFDPTEITINIFFKVANAGVWTDGLSGYLVSLRADGDNRILLYKSGATNRLDTYYIAGATSRANNNVVSPSTNWMMLTYTVSKSADQFKVYVNGSQVGSTVTGLGTWVGNLHPTYTTIGCNTTTPNDVFSGWLTRPTILRGVATPAEIFTLAQAAGVTS